MENVFNLKRFGNLLSKHLREQLRVYLMGLVVFAAIVLVALAYMSNKGGFAEPSISQPLTFMFSLLIGMYIFTASIFSDYNHPRSAFTSIMLPASVFEKFFLYWFFSLIGFTILAIGAYYLSQSIIIAYLKSQGLETIRYIFWHKNSAIPPIDWLVLTYTLLHSMAFLGAITFRKKTAIVTAMTIVVIIATYMYLNVKTTSIAINGSGSALPFLPSIALTEEGMTSTQLSNGEFWGPTILLSLTILFWITAYFKLKEREI